VVLDSEQMQRYRQEYLVVREVDRFQRVLAVVEMLSFANKEGTYVLGPPRPDLPLDLAAAFRSAYDLCAYPGWIRYVAEPVPDPALPDEDQAWVNELVSARLGD
jgi:hypothetical protein